MKVLQSKRQGNKYLLKIEESPNSVVEEMDVAFKKMVRSAKVQGFRKGKVPRAIFEREYGRGILIEEAVNTTINKAYQSAVKELDLAVVDYPKNVDVAAFEDDKPLVFSCEVEVIPEVKLGKYKGLKVEKEDPTFTDEMFDEALARLLDYYAKYEAVERDVKQDDLIRCDMIATVEGEPLSQWTREKAAIRVGAGNYGEPFDNQIVGAKIGEPKTLTLSYPEDFAESAVAGKTVEVHVTVHEVKEKKRPELTETLVAELSRNTQTVDEFKKEFRKNNEATREKEVNSKLEHTLIERVIEKMTVDVQEVLVEREINRLVKQTAQSLQRSGITIEQYMEMTKKSERDFRDEFKEDALKQVKSDLALDKVAEVEKLESSEEELIEEVKKWQEPALKTELQIQTFLRSEAAESLKSMLKRKKAIEFIVSAAKVSIEKPKKKSK